MNGGKNSDGCALLVIILIIIFGLSYYFGRIYVINLFDSVGITKKTEHYPEKITEEKEKPLPVDDSYVKETDKPKQNAEPEAEPKKTKKQKKTEKSSPAKENQISDEQKEDLKILENIEKGINERKKDLAVLEKIEKSVNQERQKKQAEAEEK